MTLATNPGAVPAAPVQDEIHVVWISAALSCDGDTISITGATQPSLEDLIDGVLPGVPRLRLHNPVLAYENGAEFIQILHQAAAGELGQFILVVEGSIPDESNKTEGYWAALGFDEATGQPIPTVHWIRQLAEQAWAVMGAGTCATYGGIHAMEGNPTGCMGLADFLGWDWKSREGVPLVLVPGCPVQADNFMDTLLHLMNQAVGRAPMIELDQGLRPVWLFGATIHENCDRAGYYEQADFAEDYNSPKCIVKQGCWGPVVQCNVGKRGWIGGVGGCPSVGGVCIGCTMPGFPDKFMSFMDMPPGAQLSTTAVGVYGRTVRALRKFTQASMNTEPEWRQKHVPLTIEQRKPESQQDAGYS